MARYLSEVSMLNARIKHYPDFDHYTVFNYEAFRSHSPRIVEDDTFFVPVYEQIPIKKGYMSPPKAPTNGGMRSDNIHRAKSKIFDIAYLNHFDYFVTLTFNAELHDRTDAKKILHTVRQYTRNIRKYDKSFSYLIIPEYHHDKKAIHLHGLFKASERLRLTASGHNLKDKTIYNLSSWKFGFSTALPLDGNRLAVSKYITKYITKDCRKIFGNMYLAGNVLRSVPEEWTYINFAAFDGIKYDIVDGFAVKYREDYNVKQH